MLRLQAPDAFNAVRVNISAHPLLGAVINTLMPCISVRDPDISGKLIRVDRFRVRRGVVGNELVEGFLVRAFDDLPAKYPAALNGCDGDGLVALVTAPHAANLSADVGFIHFHNAAQKLKAGVLYGSA